MHGRVIGRGRLPETPKFRSTKSGLSIYLVCTVPRSIIVMTRQEGRSDWVQKTAEQCNQER